MIDIIKKIENLEYTLLGIKPKIDDINEDFPTFFKYVTGFDITPFQKELSDTLINGKINYYVNEFPRRSGLTTLINVLILYLCLTPIKARILLISEYYHENYNSSIYLENYLRKLNIVDAIAWKGKTIANIVINNNYIDILSKDSIGSARGIEYDYIISSISLVEYTLNPNFKMMAQLRTR